jgi:hypothetical protein
MERSISRAGYSSEPGHDEIPYHRVDADVSGTTMPGGSRLLAARAAWVICAVLTVVVMVASVPLLLERFSSVCTDGTSACVERAEVPAEVLGTLRGAGISLGAYSAFTVGVEVLCKVVWISVATLLFVFRSRDRMALLVSFFLLTFGTATLLTNGTEVLAAEHLGWWVVARGLQVTGEVFTVLFLFTFPDGRFVPRWTPIVAVVFLLFQIPGDLFPADNTGPRFLNTFANTAGPFVFFGGVVTMLASQVYRYRRVSGPGQRRQTRWAVFGTTLAITILIVVYGTISLAPRDPADSALLLLVVGSLIPLVMLLIPLSVFVAVFRSGLFDIDVVINRALVYVTLTATLVLVYVSCVVGLQLLLSPLLGENNQLAVVASTLAIAALFNPLRHRIQSLIDRRFFRKKYDAQQTLEAFSVRLRDETDLEQLNSELLGVVRETMQPEHASLWLRRQGGMGPR